MALPLETLGEKLKDQMETLQILINDNILKVPETMDELWAHVTETVNTHGAMLSQADAQILMNVTSRMIEKGAVSDPNASRQLPKNTPEEKRSFVGPKTTLRDAIEGRPQAKAMRKDPFFKDTVEAIGLVQNTLHIIVKLRGMNLDSPRPNKGKAV